jgi:hypothetical protein
VAWLYSISYVHVQPPTPKTIFQPPRNYLLCFFSSFAAEIPALEVLAISVFHELRRFNFFAYLASTVVANIHRHLRSFILHCYLQPRFLCITISKIHHNTRLYEDNIAQEKGREVSELIDCVTRLDPDREKNCCCDPVAGANLPSLTVI